MLMGIIFSLSAVNAACINETANINLPDEDFTQTDINNGDDFSSADNSIYVDSAGGDDSHDGKSWNTSLKSFSKALDNAKDDDTIYLASGKYYGDKNTKISISKSINIVGSEDTVFDGEYMNYIFIVLDNVKVTFKNIKFVNAYKSDLEYTLIDDYELDGRYGSALDIQKATVILDNCYFKDNILNYESGIEEFSYGGALSNFGDLTILNTCFFRNSVGATVEIYGYGGSVYNKGKMFIDNSSFLNSGGSAYTYGGAIYNDGDLLINNTIIANSHLMEESKGGTIFNNDNLTLINSIIENNTIERTDFNYIYGSIFNSGNLIAYGNIFTNNTGFYKQPNSEYYGSPTVYNTGKLDLSYNAFIDNVGFNGISTDLFIAGSTGINIDNNWWGCNDNPYSIGKINLDKADSWIILDVNPQYVSLKLNESINVIASWKLSNKQIPQINLFPVFNITFSTLIDEKEIISNQIPINGQSNFTFNNTQKNGAYELKVNVCSFTTESLIEVGKSNTHITFNSSDDKIYYNETIVIDIQLTGEDLKLIDDEVIVYLNNTKYTVNIVEGKGKITFFNLTAGKYVVKLIYEGSDLYSKSMNETEFSVCRIPTRLTIKDVCDIKSSDNVNLTVNLEGGSAEGIGYLYINTEFRQKIYLNNGITGFNLNNFPQGEYNITVIYPADSYYEGSRDSVFFNVEISDVYLNISCSDITADQKAVILIETSADNFNSEAILYINNEKHTVFLSGKQNYITISNLANGTYNISVVFNGNERFTKANASSSFKVSKLKSKLDVNIVKNNLTGSIAVKTNSTKCSGIVGLYVNSRYYTKNLNKGEAIFNVSFDKGTNYIYVFYDGDKTYEGSTYNTTIGEGESFFIIGEDITSWQNTNFNYTVQLFEENGVAVPNKIVVITVDAISYNVTTNNQGIAFLTLNLKTGSYAATASYKNAKITNKISINPIKFKLNTQNITYLENEIVEVVFADNITGKINLKVSNGMEMILDISKNNVSYNLSALDVGKYSVEAFYFNNDFTSDVVLSQFNVSKADTDLNVAVSDFSLGSTGKITVNLPENASGTITFNVDEKQHIKKVTSSEIVLYLSDLDAGIHKLSVVYSGDNRFNNASFTTTFPVRDLTTPLVLSIDDEVYAKELKITANVNKSAGGNVTFKVADLTGTSKIDNGVAVWTFSGLDVGSYNITAFYSGDDSFNNASAETSFNVIKAYSAIELYVNGAYLDENIRIYAKLSPNATGTVTFSMNDYYSPRDKAVYNSSSNWLISPLETGSYTVNAVYNGDKNYYQSCTQFILNITQRRSNLKVEINDAGKNENVVINAKLTHDNGKGITGKVNVTVGDKTYRVNVNNGAGMLNIGRLDIGEYHFSAKYDGSDDYGESSCEGSFKVSDNLLDVILSCSNLTKYYGGKNKLIISLETTTNKAISGATLHVTINNNKKDYITDNNGQVMVDLNYAVGSYNVKINFDGSESYKSASCNASVTVLSTVQSKDLVKLAGSGTQYFAVFYDCDGKVLGNTNVKFNIAGKTYTFTTLPNGVARININLAPGKYVITAINPVTGQQVKNNINIYLKIMENKDLIMYYTSYKYYKVRAFGSDGKPVGAGEVVKISICGKTYTVKTDKNGYASLPINLKPKTYIITASYGGYKVSNKVVVKPILISSNLVYKKARSYKYYAKVLDSNGKIQKNKVVTFKFKGKKYYARTSQYGYAIIYLKVNLNIGSHYITTMYGKSVNTNIITVKK